MRVAYVISTLEKCGPVNVLYNTVANLGSDFECAVFTLASEPEASRRGDFEAIGVRVECVVESRLRSMLAGVGMLGRALATWRPDVIHAHGFRATVLAKGAPYPRVCTVHNCIYEDFRNGYPAVQARWMERSEVAALRRYDAVVACSESNAAFLRERYGFECSVVCNGVDQDTFRPATPEERAEARVRLGASPRNMLLTSSGACCERKASLPLATAFGEALGSRPGVEYHALGGGPLLEQCRSLGVSNAAFHGFTDDVADWLRAGDLFVSASRSEGMPMAVLEAASADFRCCSRTSRRIARWPKRSRGRGVCGSSTRRIWAP